MLFSLYICLFVLLTSQLQPQMWLAVAGLIVILLRVPCCHLLPLSADDVAYSLNLPPSPSLIICGFCADDRRSSCRHLHLLVYSAAASCSLCVVEYCWLAANCGGCYLSGVEKRGGYCSEQPALRLLLP